MREFRLPADYASIVTRTASSQAFQKKSDFIGSKTMFLRDLLLCVDLTSLLDSRRVRSMDGPFLHVVQQMWLHIVLGGSHGSLRTA